MNFTFFERSSKNTATLASILEGVAAHSSQRDGQIIRYAPNSVVCIDGAPLVVYRIGRGWSEIR